MRKEEWDYLKEFEGKTIALIEESGFKGGAVRIVFEKDDPEDDTEVQKEFTITHHLASRNPLELEVQFTKPHIF